jgi:methionyl aminopeptidase
MDWPKAALGSLREAGRVAADARELGRLAVVAGASVRETCQLVEAEIRRLGGELAFPVQASCNQFAAHCCPSPEDATLFADGDLAKLDIGVHVDGWVVDTATTVSVGDRPENRRMVTAVVTALEAALAAVEPGVPIRRIAGVIELAIRRHGLEPMHNLCGHGVGRFTVHCPPAIPNLVLPDTDPGVLVPGQVVAIEPFASAGAGLVREVGPAEVFRLAPESQGEGAGVDRRVVESLRAFRGLPFARRHLGQHPRGVVETTLEALLEQGVLTAYSPLVETQGKPVSQAEHTIAITDDGIEVLTL